MKRLKHREYLTVALAAAALIAGALCPLPAAADPGTLEVTAPSSITLGSLYGTGDATNSSATPGSVKCEGYPGYTLTIKSDDDDGKMYSGANKLAAPLKVTAVLEKGTGADVTSGGTLTDVVVTRERANCRLDQRVFYRNEQHSPQRVASQADIGRCRGVFPYPDFHGNCHDLGGK